MPNAPMTRRPAPRPAPGPGPAQVEIPPYPAPRDAPDPDAPLDRIMFIFGYTELEAIVPPPVLSRVRARLASH